MKIGLVTAEYPPMQGGVGDFTREIARALAALGHEVAVITGRAVSALDAQDEGVRIERVVRGWGWECWRALGDAARRFELDVINVQYQAAAYRMHPAINMLPLARGSFIARWPRPVPIVVTFHDLKVPYLFPKAGPLRRQAILTLARRADAVIVTNAEDEAELKSAILMLRVSSGLRRIPIGSNIAPVLPAGYKRGEWRWRWGVKPNETLIGYFGFLHPLKGGEVLIRALADLAAEGRAVKLLHIGGRTGTSDADTNASYAAHLDVLAREMGVAERVATTGYMSPDQVTACFFATDVFALPYVEGASFRHGTFHAALAHGRAIVTTRPLVWLDELQNGSNALLVPPGDAHALADGIRRVIDDPALRARLERGASELAKQFTWDRIATRTADVYKQAIG